MVLLLVLEFLKRIVAVIKYQIVYYTLGGAAQLEDFIYAKSNKIGEPESYIILHVACHLVYSKSHFHDHVTWFLFYVLNHIIAQSSIFTDLVDKSGQVAVVTGGARGIGLHVVRMLLQCNMHVIIGDSDCFDFIHFYCLSVLFVKPSTYVLMQDAAIPMLGKVLLLHYEQQDLHRVLLIVWNLIQGHWPLFDCLRRRYCRHTQ